jgi:hypothetical protein
MIIGRSTTVVIGESFAVLPPFLLAVDFFPLFFPVPLLLSHVTSAVIFMLAGPFSRNHFTYLARVLVFSATATACEQIFDAFQPGQSLHVTLPFLHWVT